MQCIGAVFIQQQDGMHHERRSSLLGAPIHAHGGRLQLTKLGVNIADRADSLSTFGKTTVQYAVGNQADQAIGRGVAIKGGEAFQRRFKKPRYL